MKVSVVVLVWRGCIDEVEVFDSSRKAIGRENEIIKEYGYKNEEDMNESGEYTLFIDTDVEVK